MFCPNCGKEFEGGFCPACGTKVEAPAAQPVAQPAVQPNFVPVAPVAPQAPAKGGNKKIIGIVAGVVAAIVAFLLVGMHKCDLCGDTVLFSGEKVEIFGESVWMCDDCIENPFGSFGF